MKKRQTKLILIYLLEYWHKMSFQALQGVQIPQKVKLDIGPLSLHISTHTRSHCVTRFSRAYLSSTHCLNTLARKAASQDNEAVIHRLQLTHVVRPLAHISSKSPIALIITFDVS